MQATDSPRPRERDAPGPSVSEAPAGVSQLQLFESIPEAIMLRRRDDVLHFANAACLRVLGAADHTRIAGHRALDLVHPDERALIERRFADILKSGRPCPRLEARMVRFDGSVIDVEASVTPIADQLPDGLLIVLRDVTERRLLEQELRQAQKMEALGQLTGGVAHDFNNLLMVIIGNLEIASEHAAGVSGLERALGRATVAAEIGADLTQRLLTFARRQPLQPQSLDLNRLVHEMRDLLRRSLGEDIDVKIDPCADLWPTSVDRGQLENAIINLAVNARDAMPDGGTLAIETANIHLDSDYARRNPEVTSGDYVLLEIADTGTGMEPEVIERAFEPFFTTKEVGRGSGLGLSMIYGFAKQSDGHVKIFSAPGHGTSIWLCLPRAASAQVPTVASAEPRQLPRGEERILVVEDNDSVREVVVAQLADLGYQTVSAPDGPSALRLLAENAAVDLLFTDLVMPNGMSGRQLAAEVRSRAPNMRVLFTSGYAGDGGRAALDLDADIPLLRKPYKKKDLAERVREVLDAEPTGGNVVHVTDRGGVRRVRPAAGARE